MEDGTAGMVLSEFHVDAGQLTELIDRLIAPGGNTVTESRPGYTPRVRRVLENAEAEAARFKSRAVGTEHLLIAILKESDCVATRLLFTMGINIQKLYGAILTAMGEAPLQGGASGNTNTGRGPQTRGGAQTSETPALDQYSRDLTELAREGKLDPVVGRGQEIERVIQILSRRTKNNPCLIGEPGVGKTAIAEGLAQRIALGIVPETIRDKRVVVLDLSGMVAGSKYRGEFEERIKRVVKEVTENENILLFIDELHTIIGAGGAEGALDASNILKPSLSRGEIQLIGATTLEEYRKYIEKDAALERRFQPVMVDEPTVEDTISILRGLKDRYEVYHGVKIADSALVSAAVLSNRYITDRFLPDKAIDLVDEKPDLIIVDPPRDGIHPKALEKILAFGVDEIVYISCKPTSLARDLETIIRRGYHVDKVCCVDQFPRTSHVETVVLLSKGEIDSKKVRVEFSLEDMDMSGFQKDATYEQIKAYVLEHTGLKVSSLYISQIKRKCGLDVGQNYNLSKKEDAKVPKCPPEKEAAIRDALKYFQMI